MIKHILSGAAAAVLAVAAVPAAAQPAPAPPAHAQPAAGAQTPAQAPAHRYLSVASARLPEPGNPLAIVFIDAGAVRKTGDTAEIEVLYVLGQPQVIRGGDTSYVSFRYQVTCGASGAKSLKTAGFTAYPSNGPARVSNEVGQPHTPPAGSLDAMIVKLACEGAGAGSGGYATLEEVLRHTHLFSQVEKAHDPKAPHAFVFLGSGTAAGLGVFDTFVDTSGALRSGDAVTVQMVEVFKKPASSEPTAPGYVLNTVTYRCVDKTQSTSFTSLFSATGAALKSVLTTPTLRAVRPNTLDERAMTTVCTNTIPAGTTPPFTTLTDALNTAWRHLATPAPAASASAAPATPPPTTPH